MSKVDTGLSAEQHGNEELRRKEANAALVRGGLSGIRWLLTRAAGPASQRAGLAGKAYNYGLRPLRAALFPNLGRGGNLLRTGAATYSAGSLAANVDNKFLKAREQMLLAAKDASPETRKMISDRATRFGAISAAFRATTGAFQGGMTPEARLADDAMKESLSHSFREGAAEHRDKVYGGKTVSAWLNPIGSRALSSGIVGAAGKKKSLQDYASQFGSKYKDLLGRGAFAGVGMTTPKKLR